MNLIELPHERWPELRVAYEECRADEPLPLPDPALSTIIAAEREGRIVGCVGTEKSKVVYVGAEEALNVSPLWVERQSRGTGLALKLAREIERHNDGRLPGFLVTTSRHVELLVFNLGFKPIQGTLWRRSYD